MNLWRRCKYFNRESWYYGSWCHDKYEINPEGIASAITCEVGFPYRIFECDYSKCPMYNPVMIDEYYKDMYNNLNNSLKHTFGHYSFKTTSREYTKYFTEI